MDGSERHGEYMEGSVGRCCGKAGTTRNTNRRKRTIAEERDVVARWFSSATPSALLGQICSAGSVTVLPDPHVLSQLIQGYHAVTQLQSLVRPPPIRIRTEFLTRGTSGFFLHKTTKVSIRAGQLLQRPAPPCKTPCSFFSKSLTASGFEIKVIPGISGHLWQPNIFPAQSGALDNFVSVRSQDYTVNSTTAWQAGPGRTPHLGGTHYRRASFLAVRSMSISLGNVHPRFSTGRRLKIDLFKVILFSCRKLVIPDHNDWRFQKRCSIPSNIAFKFVRPKHFWIRKAATQWDSSHCTFKVLEMGIADIKLGGSSQTASQPPSIYVIVNKYLTIFNSCEYQALVDIYPRP
ncbi:hypothetical protein C8R45DRAFT_942576 [Mycena sanguinolenta]|nr:hypothetical protein C8R45DRAFT_942576 [Mycena sanguinolenta]